MGQGIENVGSGVWQAHVNSASGMLAGKELEATVFREDQNVLTLLWQA